MTTTPVYQRLTLAAMLATVFAGCESGAPTREDSKVKTPAPASSVLGAEPVFLGLSEGSSVRLPTGAEPAGAPGESHTQSFRLKDGNVLLVSEHLVGADKCESLLDKDLEAARAAQADSDPARKAIRDIKTVDSRTVAGHRLIYTEAVQARAGSSKVGLAVATSCFGDCRLQLTYASSSLTLPEHVSSLLDAVMASHHER